VVVDDGNFNFKGVGEEGREKKQEPQTPPWGFSSGNSFGGDSLNWRTAAVV
jgi:hypothetical protein